MFKSTENLIKALRKISLPQEDRIALTSVLMDKVGVLPIDNVIATTPQGVMIRGKLLDKESYIGFKESCVALSENVARKVVNEQVRYLAIVEGIHKGLSPDQILFAKTAIWNMQMVDKVIEEVVLHGTGFEA